MIGMSSGKNSAIGTLAAQLGAHVLTRVENNLTTSPVCFEGEDGGAQEVMVVLQDFDTSMWDCLALMDWCDSTMRQQEQWRGGRPPQGRVAKRHDRTQKPHRSKCGAFHRG